MKKYFRGTRVPPEVVLKAGFKAISTRVVGDGELQPDEIPVFGVLVADDRDFASMFGNYMYEVVIPRPGLLKRSPGVSDGEYVYAEDIPPKYITYLGDAWR